MVSILANDRIGGGFMMNSQLHSACQMLRIIWHYLNQPVDQKEVPMIWNPLKFARHDRVQTLERCWELAPPLAQQS